MTAPVRPLRDPRVEPKVGDIVKIPRHWRPLEIAAITSDVTVWGNDGARRRKMSLCSLSIWPELAKNSEVIHCAD